MGALRQSSKVNSNLGVLQIIAGNITVSSGTWTLDDQSDAVTLTDIGAGNVSLQFNYPFISAPVVVCSILKLTPDETDVVKHVLVESISTTECEFVHHSIDHTTSGVCDIVTVDPDDADGWEFLIVGTANS